MFLLTMLLGCESQSEREMRTLVAKLDDPDPTRREQAAKDIGRIGPAAKEAVPALTEALDDDDYDVTIAVINTLADIGPVAVPALIQALGDEDNDVRLHASLALSRINQDSE